MKVFHLPHGRPRSTCSSGRLWGVAMPVLLVAICLIASLTGNVGAVSEPVQITLSPALPTLDHPACLLVEAGQTLRLEAHINDSLLANGDENAPVGEPSIWWECDSGSLDRVQGPVVFWTPPIQGADVVIRVQYEAFYKPASWWGRFSNAYTSTGTTEVRVVAAASSGLMRDGRLDGFHIGRYPDVSNPAVRAQSTAVQRNPGAYQVPSGFYKMTAENRDLYVSENFRLGDFAHDYPWGSLGLPQYVALDWNLVLKLEDLLALMRRDYPHMRPFRFVYGFRPPAYNQDSRINAPEDNLKAAFSMHQYGKAADIIVDEDNDLVLDDLNGDGQITIADALAMQRYVDVLDQAYLDAGDPRLGGAGVYARNDFKGRKQTPYLHIDVRGFAGITGRPMRWTEY